MTITETKVFNAVIRYMEDVNNAPSIIFVGSSIMEDIMDKKAYPMINPDFEFLRYMGMSIKLTKKQKHDYIGFNGLIKNYNKKWYQFWK